MKGNCPLFEQTKTPCPKDILCQVWYMNYTCGSGELNLAIFTLFTPLGRGTGPSFKKHESPFLKDGLDQVWLKLAL